MSKARSNRDPLAPLSERHLAALALKLVREGRMPSPDQLVAALAGARDEVSRKLARVPAGDVVSVSRPDTYHRVFVSSSQRDGSTSAHARAGLNSPSFHDLILDSHRLPGVEGGKSGIGYWVDGAEESRIVHVSRPDVLDEIAAALGKKYRQKAVLHFRSDASGSDIAHVLRVPHGDGDKIAHDLLQHGIEYKTIIPADDGSAEVHIVDMGGVLTPNVAGYVSQASADHTQHLGHASFIGAETREEAEKVYDTILSRRAQKIRPPQSSV